MTASQNDTLQLLLYNLNQKQGIQLLAADGSTRVDELAQAEFISLCVPSQTPDNRINLPKNAPTRYKNDNDDFYDLQTLWFCAACRDDSVGEYLQKATTVGVKFVTTTSRQSVLDFLFSKREAGPEIDLLPEGSPLNYNLCDKLTSVRTICASRVYRK